MGEAKFGDAEEKEKLGEKTRAEFSRSLPKIYSVSALHKQKIYAANFLEKETEDPHALSGVIAGCRYAPDAPVVAAGRQSTRQQASRPILAVGRGLAPAPAAS